jgi:hypothetical protein
MPNLLNPSRLAPVGGGGSAYVASVLADSPLAYYRKGEASGTTMVDASGNGRDGVYSGGFTLGTAGATTDGDTQVTYNGSTGKATVADAAWMNPTFLTVEAFVMQPSSSGEKMIASRDAGGSSRQWQFYWANTRKLSANVWRQDGVFQSIQSVALTNGVTYHSALTWDGTTEILYVNGVLAASVAFAGTNLKSVSGQPINVANLLGSEFWLGTIDELAIYGTALSGTRIAAHYAAR